MAEVTKSIILATTKEIARRALLPNVLLVPFLIFIHWVAISLWFYYNYNHENWITVLIVSTLGGSFSVLTYSMWGLRRFLIKSYLIIHHNIILLWLHPFCKKMADKVLYSDLLLELESEELSIIREWSNYLITQSKELPQLLQRIIRHVLRKIGYSDDLAYKIKLIKNKDTDEIANLISDEIAYQLIYASNNLVPAKIIYLIPINIILIIILWFF